MNVPWLELPDASVAVQVTGVLPSGNCDPDGGVHFTFGFGSMLSVGGDRVADARAVLAGRDRGDDRSAA